MLPTLQKMCDRAPFNSSRVIQGEDSLLLRLLLLLQCPSSSTHPSWPPLELQGAVRHIFQCPPTWPVGAGRHYPRPSFISYQQSRRTSKFSSCLDAVCIRKQRPCLRMWGKGKGEFGVYVLYKREAWCRRVEVGGKGLVGGVALAAISAIWWRRTGRRAEPTITSQFERARLSVVLVGR